jgi:hypothetical protein
MRGRSLLPSTHFSLGGRKLFALFLLEPCEGLLQVLVQSIAGVPDHRQMLGEVLTMPSLDEDVIPSALLATGAEIPGGITPLLPAR